MPIILDGKAIAARSLDDTRARLAELRTRDINPGLAVIIVGDDPASHAYVRNKVKTCATLGIHSRKIALPATTTQDELLAHIHALNDDPAIHGILVQSPPPPHIDETAIIAAIAPHKDVDGFHPTNVAKLALDDPTGFVPCTPLGCQYLLHASDIPTVGRHIVIVGRSHLVGKPLALLLMQKSPLANATVTIAHSHTTDLPALCRSADILVAAIGRPHYITADFIRPGTTVLDVGINRIPDPSTKSGHRLVGDVHYDTVAPIAHAITPVPGGIGPMTIAMLMHNTTRAANHVG